MDKTHLRPVSLTELSNLRHEVFISNDASLIPEFLVIRYFGVYRAGGAGGGDALYIVATAAAARAAWCSHATILDFRQLEYLWGDEMEWVASITWDRVIQYDAPLGIVAGENCRTALKSLLRDRYDTFCVETVEDAYAMCRRKAKAYQKYLKEWKPGVAPTPPPSSR